jgi:DNA-directed RNA polymerase specialized sigma24 family protein
MAMRYQLITTSNTQQADEEAETLITVGQFAREAARGFGHLDPEDVQQEVALKALLKMRQGAVFGPDGRTRAYVKNAVYWLATAGWRKLRRARRHMENAAVDHAELLPVALSPSFEKILEDLSPDQRALMFRVAVNDESLVDIGHEVAITRFGASGLQWEQLDEVDQAACCERAYQLVYKRYRRTRQQLAAALRAASHKNSTVGMV